jgi:hypothetical protein
MDYRISTPLATSPVQSSVAIGGKKGIRKARRRAIVGTIKNRISEIKCQSFGKKGKCFKR